MQLSLLMDKTESHSPIIWIVGTIVTASPVFSIDSTLSRGNRKQRKGYDVIKRIRQWQLLRMVPQPYQIQQVGI